MKLVAVGGTFDKLHKGHKAILSKAFETGERVIVGITSDEMLEKEAEPYSKRRKAIEDFLSNRNYGIVKLEDPYGPAITDKNIDAIVVSEETEFRAFEINKIRKKKGLKQLEIIVIPLVLARDRKPISSTRIRAGEIDAEGNLLQ